MMNSHEADLHSILIRCINHLKHNATTEERNDLIEELACWLFNVHRHYNVHPIHGNARLVSMFKDIFTEWDDE
jgi:hypothetical protein